MSSYEMEITGHSYNILKSIIYYLAHTADLHRNIFWHNIGLTVNLHYFSFIINKFITSYLKLNIIFKIIYFLIGYRNTTQFIREF